MKLKKTIEYGLYLLAFLLPWQTRWIIRDDVLEYERISLYGIDVLLVLILCGVAFFVLRNKYSRRQTTDDRRQVDLIWWVIAGLELIIFISIFMASDKTLAVYHYLVFLLGFGLFWLVLKVKYNFNKLIMSFVSGVFLQACLGIWQFISQSSFACKWLGLASHDPYVLGTSVVETAEGVRWLRAYGGLDHPNVLGGVLVVGMLIALYNRRQTTDNRQQTTDNRMRLNAPWSVVCSLLSHMLFWISWLIMLVALFFTFSRAAWLSLGVGFGIIFIYSLLKRNWEIVKKLSWMILISGVLVFALITIYNDLFQTRMASGARLEAKSTSERLAGYKEASEIIKDNRLLGVGIGNYVVESRKSKVESHNEYIQPVHNVFLLVWAEIGLFGISIFTFFILLTLYFQLKRFKKDEHPIIQLSILIALSIMFAFDHWLWSLHFGVLLFWFIMGLVYKITFNKTEICINKKD